MRDSFGRFVKGNNANPKGNNQYTKNIHARQNFLKILFEEVEPNWSIIVKNVAIIP